MIQWNFRKGYDVLIKSFVNKFTSKDDVCLVFATQYGKDVVMNDLKQFIPRDFDLPQIVLHNDIIPTECMPSFYKHFNCYVHLSRGEGFSLTQIEAGACGLPVISAYHSGMTEYLNENNSFIVPCNDFEICNNRLASVCFYYQNQLLWKLGEKEIKLTSDYMDFVFNNYKESLNKSKIFYNDIVDKYTWMKTTERVSKLL